jgi:hypothetical protein
MGEGLGVDRQKAGHHWSLGTDTRRNAMAMSVKLPPDDVGATLQRRDGVRGQRYGEIFLIGTDTATGRLVGSVYNTTGLNEPFPVAI